VRSSKSRGLPAVVSGHSLKCRRPSANAPCSKSTASSTIRSALKRDEEPCRAAECSRGAVRASVFCRVHQFENVRRRPSPFKH
jgi:hypothetical protein